MRIVTDLLVLGGAAALSYGAWEAYPPAGFVVGGVLLLAGGLLRGRAEALNNATPKRGRGAS